MSQRISFFVKKTSSWFFSAWTARGQLNLPAAVGWPVFMDGWMMMSNECVKGHKRCAAPRPPRNARAGSRVGGDGGGGGGGGGG
jgi:hypothetical protein